MALSDSPGCKHWQLFDLERAFFHPPGWSAIFHLSYFASLLSSHSWVKRPSIEFPLFPDQKQGRSKDCQTLSEGLQYNSGDEHQLKDANSSLSRVFLASCILVAGSWHRSQSV